MKKKKYHLLLSTVLICIVSGSIYGQEQKSISDRADELFRLGDYAMAARLYEGQLNRKKIGDSIFRRLSVCYRETDQYQRAIDAYSKVIVSPDVKPEDWLNYGDMLRAASRYEDARQAYLTYETKSGKRVPDRILGCTVDWDAAAISRNVESMHTLNTAKSDWGAVYSKTERSIVFVSDSLRTSLLAVKSEKYGRTGNNYAKLYTQKEQAGTTNNFSPLLNDYKYNVGPVAFTRNEDTAYITVTDPGKVSTEKEKDLGKTATHRLELYISVKKYGNWTKPVPFIYNNPDKYSVGHAALSNDGNTLYFTSDMQGGIGGTDIWYCAKDTDGKWRTPVNCGAVINTEEDEAFPSVGPDDAFYFSSKGHAGMGGYDVFMAQGERDTWVYIENMQKPVNSAGDDFSFNVKNDKEAFLASNRPGGKGSDDLYTAYGNWGEVNRSLVKIVVIDGQTYARVPGVGINITGAEKTISGITNSYGYFEAKVKKGSDLHVTTSKEKFTDIDKLIKAGELKDTLYVFARKKDKSTEKPIIKDTAKIEVAHFMVNYDFDKSTLRVKEQKELDRMILLMKNDSTLNAVVASFTDPKGSNMYNEKLSQRRTVSVRNYLLANGIPASRITTEAYGKEYQRLKAKQYNESEQEINRRTEFVLTRKANETWAPGKGDKRYIIENNKVIKAVDDEKELQQFLEYKKKEEEGTKKMIEQAIKDSSFKKIVDTSGPALAPDIQFLRRKEQDAMRLTVLRKNSITKEITVTSDTIEVEFYDNAIEDADTVTVFFNSKLIAYKERLKSRVPISFKLALSDDATQNQMIVFAESLGTEPPNTGIMIVKDANGHRWQVNIYCDFSSNMLISFKKDKERQ